MIYAIVAVIIVLLFLLYCILLAPGKLPGKADPRLWSYKYAHRGLHTKDQSTPENSLAAFEAAASSGYGMELDVNITLDGHIVVFHDDSLLRVCGVDKKLSDCTLKELKGYPLFGSDQRIPLFSEVLELIGGRVPLIVELKHTGRHRELCEKTAELLDAYDGLYCVESFDPTIVRWFCRNRPHFVRGQLANSPKHYGALPLNKKLLLSSLLLNFLTRPHFVAYLHWDAHHKLKLLLFRLFGGKLVGWTVEDDRDRDFSFRFFDAVIFQYFKP